MTHRTVALGLLLALVSAPLASASAAGAVAPTPARLRTELDGYMQAQVREHHFSGTVIVARDGRMLLAKGYGLANVEWQVPNTLRTKFRIGSLTKQFTATLIMQLREAGRLNLQDSICKYLDPCVAAWQPVTLAQLLSHTSGIAGYGGKPNPGSPPAPPWTAAQIAASFRDRPLQFVPGTKWQYSDWGYCLLGLVIEKVTGKPYATVVDERIFEPLGMRDSGYDRPELILKERAAGYRWEGGVVNAAYIDMAGPYAAGGLYSTAQDLYKWDQALYSDKVLPRPALELMWTEVISNYGFGWMVVRPTASTSRPPPWAVPGHFQVVHPGNINGFSSEILRFPDDHTTVIVLANLEDAVSIGPELAARVFGQKFSLPSAPH
jgi:CubicO group peptidase (beta-lactamase class C family)